MHDVASEFACAVRMRRNNKRELVLKIMGVFHLQKNSENFYREFPFGERAFHLSQVPFVHRTLSVASLNLPGIFKMEANEAHQMLFLCEMSEVSIEEESLINSEDDTVDIFSAASKFMRRNLQ